MDCRIGLKIGCYNKNDGSCRISSVCYEPNYAYRERERERERERPRGRAFIYNSFVVGIAVVGVFLLSADVAFAATRAGEAKTSTGTDNSRHWMVSTVSGRDATTATTDQVFQSAAGADVTLHFTLGTTGVAPLAANKFTLQILNEDTGTVRATLANQIAEPASGTTYTFTPSVAGTFRIKVTAQKDDGVGGVGNYGPVNSDTDGNKGYLRAGTTLTQANNASSPAAYPDTVIATTTLGHAPNQSVSTTVDFRQSGASVDNQSVSSATADFVKSDAIDNTYASSNTAVDARVTFGNSALSGLPWTHLTAVPSGFTQVGAGAVTSVEKSGAFTADPRIYFSSNGTAPANGYVASTTHSVYNRAESVSTSFYLLNARDEKLSIPMTVGFIGSDGTTDSTAASATPSSNLYSVTQTLLTTAKAAADTTGDAAKVRVTNTNQSKDSSNGFRVSSLYFVDSHPQLNKPTLNADDFPTEDANETKVGIIAADTFNFFAHVKNVRKDTNIDTLGSAVQIVLKKPDGSVKTTFTTDTGSNGWTANNDFSLEAPGGTWTATASTTFNGNAGSDDESLVFVSPYSGKFRIDAVGWNQTYNIGDTARFTIRTMQLQSNGINFAAQPADTVPKYDLKYWDGATWQDLASGDMTALSASATYEITYAIPNDSAWIGRKIVIFFKTQISGTEINVSREIEVVGSPAQVIINSMTDTTVPTISASVRVTNEGTAAFEYTYEWCVVSVDTNQCGGGDDVAYGSAAKLIQAGANFDTTLTLNVTTTGTDNFKVAVWWSNKSSKASRTFTATSVSESSPSGGGGSGGGGGGIIATPTPQPTAEQQNTFAAVWQKIAEILSRILGLESRMSVIEARVAVLEKQPSQRVVAPAPAPQPAPRQDVFVPQPKPKPIAPKPKVEAPPKERFRIRLQ